jgi:hypothetical protein
MCAFFFFSIIITIIIIINSRTGLLNGKPSYPPATAQSPQQEGFWRVPRTSAG